MAEAVSIDEFLSARKHFVTPNGVLLKASRNISSWDKEAMSARFVMSAEVEDRDRDVVLQDGLKTEEFEKNPVAFFAHRSYEPPVGQWSDVVKLLTGRPKRLEGKLTLTKGDPMAERLALHFEAGSMRACSIGFLPKAVERREVPEDKRDSYYYPGYKILEAELVECSPCGVPSNPAALAKTAAGGDTFARELIEDILDNWARNPESGLLVPREEYEKAFKIAKKDGTSIVVKVPNVTQPVDPAPPSEPTAEAMGMFRSFLSMLSGDAGAAAIERKRQEDLAAAEAAEAADAAERAEMETECSALESRMAAKSI